MNSTETPLNATWAHEFSEGNKAWCEPCGAAGTPRVYQCERCGITYFQFGCGCVCGAPVNKTPRTVFKERARAVLAEAERALRERAKTEAASTEEGDDSMLAMGRSHGLEDAADLLAGMRG